MSQQNLDKLKEVLERYGREPGTLLPVLEETQRVYGYLSEEAMERIADALDIPVSRVYGVATFYSLLSTTPKGTHIIRLCASAPCHIKGAKEILDTLQRQLRIQPGQTTTDGLFTLEETSCLGVCDRAPAMIIDDVVYGNLTPAKVGEILDGLRHKRTAVG